MKEIDRAVLARRVLEHVVQSCIPLCFLCFLYLFRTPCIRLLLATQHTVYKGQLLQGPLLVGLQPPGVLRPLESIPSFPLNSNKPIMMRLIICTITQVINHTRFQLRYLEFCLMLKSGSHCQETRTLVIFFSDFLTYGHSLLSIPHYVFPLHTA